VNPSGSKRFANWPDAYAPSWASRKAAAPFLGNSPCPISDFDICEQYIAIIITLCNDYVTNRLGCVFDCPNLGKRRLMAMMANFEVI
jgi:hypothetical protein